MSREVLTRDRESSGIPDQFPIHECLRELERQGPREKKLAQACLRHLHGMEVAFREYLRLD